MKKNIKSLLPDEIADELKTLAIHGDGYTAEQFKRDMTREALYTLTDKRLKQRQ